MREAQPRICVRALRDRSRAASAAILLHGGAPKQAHEEREGLALQGAEVLASGAVMRTRSFNTGWEFAAPSWLDAAGNCGKLGFSSLEWLPARVPGHVHLDLIRHGIIADPSEGRAELGCQWVDESSWVFRKRFEFSKDAQLPRQLLRFAGLDTVCRVWLNGEQLAAHDNMFVPLELELTGKLREGENELRIEFESAARVGRE